MILFAECDWLYIKNGGRETKTSVRKKKSFPSISHDRFSKKFPFNGTTFKSRLLTLNQTKNWKKIY